jgi:hypothetical protein
VPSCSPGCVGYVSKSGGMSNELNNIMAQHTDGVAEGVAIGGDRYPGSRFIDHLLRFEAAPHVKMLVLLGEVRGTGWGGVVERDSMVVGYTLKPVPPLPAAFPPRPPRFPTPSPSPCPWQVGGTDEYDVAAAIADGRLKKPLVAWCIGTCAKLFPFEVQFGHAGALANAAAQTADAKNAALAGAAVLSSSSSAPTRAWRLPTPVTLCCCALFNHAACSRRRDRPSKLQPFCDMHRGDVLETRRVWCRRGANGRVAGAGAPGRLASCKRCSL